MAVSQPLSPQFTCMPGCAGYGCHRSTGASVNCWPGFVIACTASLMRRNWLAPFWCGVSALLMRSNSSGGAQLPANSDTQLTVLKS